MTIDWFVIFTPLAVLVICLLFLFVGCAKFTSAPAATPAPGTPPAGTTVCQLIPAPDLQNIAPGLPNKAVTKIDVTFDLTQNTVPTTSTVTRSGTIQNPAGGPIVPTDPTAIFEQDLSDAIVGPRDRIQCTCVVTVTDASGDTNIKVTPAQAGLAKDGLNKFRLEPLPPPNPKNPQRKFQVIFDAAGP